jgi:hypothetical protein
MNNNHEGERNRLTFVNAPRLHARLRLGLAGC